MLWRWPDDYVTLDDGRLTVRRDLVDAFRRTGWNTARDVLTCRPDEVVRRLKPGGGWENARVLIPADRERTVAGWLKRYRNVPRSNGLAVREADAVGWCQSAGVPCMSVIAVGRADGTGEEFTEFFLSEAVPDAVSAYDFVQARQPVPESDPQIVSVLHGIAHTAAALHAAGLYHGDCHWQHFLLPDGRPGPATLIDLAQVQRAAGLRGQYRWIKDMAQIHNSLCRCGAPRPMIAEWYTIYDAACRKAGFQPWRGRTVRSLIEFRHTLRHRRRQLSRWAGRDAA